MTQEDLLTLNEIASVLLEAQSPEWLTPNLIGLGQRKTSIFSVSTETGIIMVRGNDSTGMEHITQRHRFGRQVWRQDKDKLETTSEFRYGIAPYKYSLIAMSVYKPENLDVGKNTRPGEFDLYIGKHLHLNGDWVTYKLLTYKGTGIVHTLFPNKTDNHRKRLLTFCQGNTGWKWNLKSGIHTYTIPYKNKAGHEVFQFIIRGISGYSPERWYVQLNEVADPVYPQTVFLGEIVLEGTVEHGPLRSFLISDGDKYKFEQATVQLLKGTFDYDKHESLYIHQGRSAGSVPTYFTW